MCIDSVSVGIEWWRGRLLNLSYISTSKSLSFWTNTLVLQERLAEEARQLLRKPRGATFMPDAKRIDRLLALS